MIGVRNFSARLGGVQVLHEVTFAAGPGEFVAVCGPNGAGKTTLLQALAGLLPGGHVRARDTAYMEQGARSAWGLTVAELVALGRIPWADTQREAVARAMRACDVERFADRRVETLSGGQVRRAMLARALATQPEHFLLDEPVADLDPAAAHDIMRLLARLARDGRTVVAVLHAVELAAAYATRMLVLVDGRIVADGAPHAVLPAAAAAFGMVLVTDGAPRLARAAGQEKA